MPYGSHNLGNNSKTLFEDGTGPGLDPVGGEFQPSFETGYPGGGAYLIFVSFEIRVLRFTDSSSTITIGDPILSRRRRQRYDIDA